MLPQIDVNKEVDKIDEQDSNSIIESEIHSANEDDLPTKLKSMHLHKLELNPQDHTFYGRSR